MCRKLRLRTPKRTQRKRIDATVTHAPHHDML